MSRLLAEGPTHTRTPLLYVRLLLGTTMANNRIIFIRITRFVYTQTNITYGVSKFRDNIGMVAPFYFGFSSFYCPIFRTLIFSSLVMWKRRRTRDEADIYVEWKRNRPSLHSFPTKYIIASLAYEGHDTHNARHSPGRNIVMKPLAYGICFLSMLIYFLYGVCMLNGS